MEHNKVSVKIYGQEYVVGGDTSEEHILKVAEYVDSKMREIAQHVSSSTTSAFAVLSAVNVADEYFSALDKIHDLQEEIQKLKKDSLKYEELWEDAKKNFAQYQTDNSSIRHKNEDLQSLVKDKKNEIQLLNETNAQLMDKCKEIENAFFDLQMENIQLKNQIERYKK